MIRWLVMRKLDSVERRLGASVDYLRHMARVSLSAFFKFAKIIPMASYRRSLPKEPYFVAVIVATRSEDCGPCVQIGVNHAKQAGVPLDVIQPALDRRPDLLPADLAAVYRFAEAIVAKSPDADELRNVMRQQYGEEGLVEMALAIAACRVFPVTKRVLGYAKSCSVFPVEI